MSHAHFLFGFLAAASLAGCGGGGTNQPSEPVPPPPNSIRIVSGAETKGSGAFVPNPFTVTLASGGLVRWFNDDQTEGTYGGSRGTAHNITADDGSFVSGTLAPAGSFQFTFGAEGTYPYHCSIHPTMQGMITVTP